MPSTVEDVVNGIADQLVLLIEELELDPSVVAYKWQVNPGAGFDSLPAAVVESPLIGRTEVDKREDHLGSRDLYLTFSVTFVFDLSDVDYTMPQAVQTVSRFIDAVDSNPTLEGTAQEAKVVNAEPSLVAGEGTDTALPGYVCAVEALAFL